MPLPATLPAFAIALLLALTACTRPVSWQTLLTAKIVQQYPAYQVEAAADGNMIVHRPGLADVPVDIDAIAKFCRRGARDCDYATDQMLLMLAGAEKSR